MPTDINKGFDNGDLLRDIRLDILNPITVKVKDLDRRVVDVKATAEQAFNSVEVKHDEKLIEFHGVQGGGIANLTGMFREGSDLEIQGDTGPTIPGITKVKYVDSTIRRNGTGDIDISYKWDTLVPANQEHLKVGTLGTSQIETKYLFFKGAKVVHTPGDITTVDVTTATEPLMGSIPSKQQHQTPVPITEIELEGDVDSSNIIGSKLIINMNGKGGTPLTSQNFLGFFDSLGDIESQVTSPVDGKSYAFAKDSKLGGNYYTPYFYVNGKWQELRKDPALTYEDPNAPLPVGVFSVKPSTKIKVDANGQLDLDGLSTPQLPSHFKGFFETLEALKQEVPRPVIGQDWAYVRNEATGGLVIYRAGSQGSATKWSIVAPMGSFAVIDRSTTPPTYAQSFGVYKDNDWVVDSKGILSLKPVNTKTNAQIVDWEGNVTGGDFDTIQFMAGKSYARLQGTKLFLNQAQRVISYTSDFEQSHNGRDYEGNIFYDENSQTWMGWGVPKAPGAVDKKWTRIAHPKMSDEVKDLSKRLPAKCPSVEIGILGDSRLWDYNGYTFLEKDSESLPAEIKNVCGAYITTIIQDKDAPEVTIPQNRMQKCIADQEGSVTFIRRFISTGSAGSETSWSPWVRTSFSKKDINAHENDPRAHVNVIKYHKVTAINATFAGLLDQYGGPGSASTGFLHGDDCDLIVDNYGYTEGTDYLEFPYPGKFRVRGEFFVSGYSTNNYPDSKWEFTIIKESKTGQQTLLGQFNYEHKNKTTVKYPPIFFIKNDLQIEEDDKVYIKFKCDQEAAIKNKHPHLYFVPIKSQIIVEDMGTLSGTKIGATYKKHLSNLNAFGDVEVKAHYANYDSASNNVRVYGDKVNKTPVEMKTS